MVPSPMRARRPRSRVGVLPFTLAPQESVSGCRAAAVACRSCERASCNIGSGTGHFGGNRDVLPISIVGCDLVKKGSSPQKAQKSQNEFRDFESWQSEVDPHGDGLTGCMQIARNLCDGFGSQRLAGFQCSALFVFLCLLWPSPARVPLPNFAKGSISNRPSRRGSPQCLSGPSWSFVCLRGSLFSFCLFSVVSGKRGPRPPRRGGSFEGEETGLFQASEAPALSGRSSEGETGLFQASEAPALSGRSSEGETGLFQASPKVDTRGVHPLSCLILCGFLLFTIECSRVGPPGMV